MERSTNSKTKIRTSSRVLINPMTNSFGLIRINDLIGGQRQFDDKCSARARLAVDGDCAAVDAEDLSGDVEAKAKTPKLWIDPARSKRLKILDWSSLDIPGP
jgi:hypothetical protein